MSPPLIIFYLSKIQGRQPFFFVLEIDINIERNQSSRENTILFPLKFMFQRCITLGADIKL